MQMLSVAITSTRIEYGSRKRAELVEQRTRLINQLNTKERTCENLPVSTKYQAY